MANASATFSNLGTQGGIIPVSYVGAAGNNVTQVLNQPGQVISIILGNAVATPRFVKFYDVANAPTSGLQNLTPVLNLIVPGNANGAGSNIIGAAGQPFAGFQFVNGIAFTTIASAAVADNSGINAGDLVISIGYHP